MYSIPESHDGRFPRLVDKFCQIPDYPLITKLPQLAVILTNRADSSTSMSGSFHFTKHSKYISTEYSFHSGNRSCTIMLQEQTTYLDYQICCVGGYLLSTLLNEELSQAHLISVRNLRLFSWMLESLHSKVTWHHATKFVSVNLLNVRYLMCIILTGMMDTYRHSVQRCGEQFLDDPHGEIIVKSHQLSMQCLWLITSKSDHRLLVTVVELNIGNTGTYSFYDLSHHLSGWKVLWVEEVDSGFACYVKDIEHAWDLSISHSKIYPRVEYQTHYVFCCRTLNS